METHVWTTKTCKAFETINRLNQELPKYQEERNTERNLDILLGVVGADT
jgi:hypothetical protein